MKVNDEAIRIMLQGRHWKWNYERCIPLVLLGWLAGGVVCGIMWLWIAAILLP